MIKPFVVQSIEQRIGRPLEEFLRDAFRQKRPVTKIAAELSVAPAEVTLWLDQYNIKPKSHPKDVIEGLLVGYVTGTIVMADPHEPEEDVMTNGRLQRSFYEQSAIQVARSLLGRYVHVAQEDGSVIVARLREIAAYEGATRTTSEGAFYEPGRISVSTKFGKNLIDIATGKTDRASCVTLRSANIMLEDEVEKIHGPGNLSRALGITNETKHRYEGLSASGCSLWIEGEPADQTLIRRRKGNASNCKGIFVF